MGWTSLLIGLFIIHAYNYWTWNIALFVTLLGWAYFVRAIVIMFVPQLWIKTEAHEPRCITTCAVLRLIWGIALCWIAMQ